uniref:Uncharacterized protein n=1 Tax=Romanomermis culicivorax TaxID=13658 RepID=A0A915L005_ROMCU
MINISIWSPNGQLNQIQAVRCVIRNRTVCTNASKAIDIYLYFLNLFSPYFWATTSPTSSARTTVGYSIAERRRR